MTPDLTNFTPDLAVRGSGNTAKQMLDAPDGATFIWCNDQLDYPMKLYRRLKDLKLLPESQRLTILSRSVLSASAYRLRGFNGPVILDHTMGPAGHNEYDGMSYINYVNERFKDDQKVVEL